MHTLIWGINQSKQLVSYCTCVVRAKRSTRRMSALCFSSACLCIAVGTYCKGQNWTNKSDMILFYVKNKRRYILCAQTSACNSYILNYVVSFSYAPFLCLTAVHFFRNSNMTPCPYTVSRALLANLSQTAVWIKSRGLDDFIKSTWWALSATRSVSLSSNQPRAVILSFCRRRAKEEQALPSLFHSPSHWRGNDRLMAQVCLWSISTHFSSLYLLFASAPTAAALPPPFVVQSHEVIKDVWSSLLEAL